MPHSSAATRGKVIEGLRAAALSYFQSLLPGLIASYAHLRGHQSNDLPAVLDQVAILVRDYAARNPKAMAEKFRRAAERYALLR